MNTNNKTRPIPMCVFAEAALTYFKCQPDEIEIQMITENKEAFVVYREAGYKICTREILRENIEAQLTDKHAVHDIDLGCWITTIKNTVRINLILRDLIRTIKNTEEAKKLLIAVALAAYTDDANVAFWEVLARIDSGGDILGNVIVTTAKVYSGPGLINDLTELQIMHGSRIYNKFEGGIFETVYVDDPHGPFEFYIYSSEHYFTE